MVRIPVSVSATKTNDTSTWTKLSNSNGLWAKDGTIKGTWFKTLVKNNDQLLTSWSNFERQQLFLLITKPYMDNLSGLLIYKLVSLIEEKK